MGDVNTDAAAEIARLRDQATGLLVRAMQLEADLKTVQGPRKVTLELVGVNGNVFAVMGAWRAQALREGWSDAEIGEVLNEAKRGDYNHLLATIMDHTMAPDTEDDEGEDDEGDEDEDDWPGWDDDEDED